MAKTEKSISTDKELEYTVDEFVAAARPLFGCNKACVEVALKNRGITKTTEEKAKKIVNEFLKREVNN